MCYNIYWSWDPAHGLTASDVPSHVFNDIMAMHYASKAVAQNNENISAMSVFVAANLRRDRNLAGETDLVYGNLAYSPAFYATVFGPEIAQHVLAKAIVDKDTALALDAIGALSPRFASLLCCITTVSVASVHVDKRTDF